MVPEVMVPEPELPRTLWKRAGGIHLQWSSSCWLERGSLNRWETRPRAGSGLAPGTRWEARGRRIGDVQDPAHTPPSCATLRPETSQQEGDPKVNEGLEL